MSKYFFTQLPSYGGWGPKTNRDPNHATRVQLLHVLLDSSPKSWTSRVTPYLLLTDEVREAFAPYSGLKVYEGLIEPSDVFKELGASRKLPKLYWAEVTGVAHQDDFGLERGARLIVSERVKTAIEKFPHERVTFVEGTAPSDEELQAQVAKEVRARLEGLRQKRK